MAESQKPKFTAYTITKREGKDDFWHPIGAAFPTKSGDGLVLQLTSLPLDGRITLMPWKPPKDNGDK